MRAVDYKLIPDNKIHGLVLQELTLFSLINRSHC